MKNRGEDYKYLYITSVTQANFIFAHTHKYLIFVGLCNTKIWMCEGNIIVSVYRNRKVLNLINR